MEINDRYRVFDKYLGSIGVAIVSSIEKGRIVLTYLDTGKKNFIKENDLNYQPEFVFQVKDKIYLAEEG